MFVGLLGRPPASFAGDRMLTLAPCPVHPPKDERRVKLCEAMSPNPTATPPAPSAAAPRRARVRWVLGLVDRGAKASG